jgi:hypothetical protein
VDRLVKIFDIEGCGNLESEHRVAAVIDSNALTNALSMTGITQEHLLDRTSYVNLAFERDARLICVYGNIACMLVTRGEQDYINTFHRKEENSEPEPVMYIKCYKIEILITRGMERR